jgi:uncharacterized protein YggE
VNLSEASAGAAQPRPMLAMTAERAAVPTPVETGEITVSVDVTGEFELAH